ncbi:MAG: RidA family protein [Geminicoccaceae bacterium]|nr:RidA family protein [Geminicoccaceae bacterium]
MLQRLTPEGVAAPAANYSHATLVPPNATWLYVSGQLGVRPDGSIPDDTQGQTEQIFENLGRVLASAGMTMADVVRLNAFLVDPRDLATYMKVRDSYVAQPPPASTLVVVRALARPVFRVEVEAVAAADRTHREGAVAVA